MRGGWRGGMGTVGGITRTYGLQSHFTRDTHEGPPPRITADRMRRIAQYFRPYLRRWLVVIACLCVSACIQVLPPFCVAAILDRAIPQGDTVLLSLLAGAMVGLAIAGGLLGVLQQSLTARIGQGILFDIRTQLYRHLQRLSLRFYTSARSGEIVSRVNNDVNAVQHVATDTLVTIAGNIATLVATSVALFSRNWRLALLAVAVVPAFYFPSRIVGRIRRRLSTQTLATQASLMSFMTERLHVGGHMVTHIFGQTESDAREFEQTGARLRDLNVKQTIVGRWLFMILSVFSAVGPALIFWYGGFEAIRSDLQPGLLVAFAALLALLYRPMVQLATVYVDVQAAVAVFDRIFEYMDLEPDVQDRPRTILPPVMRGHVVFKDVGFSYPRPCSAVARDAENNGNGDEEESRFALQGVSFEIPPGKRVALVGPSGAGKTTITYLVPRFYDPDSGAITLDGVDLRDMPQEALRRQIGMVTQETFLFHATIRENLLVARPDAGQEQLDAACRAANIHEFIKGLPEGYDTTVGERGFRLSGGEKQRISVARALLKDPPILILDEATSHLDATSEHLIQLALEELLRGRTSLIIAHRLSTILGCDTIVVLDGGRVAESGSHAELLERGGLYAKLFHQQFAKVLGHGQGGKAAV